MLRRHRQYIPLLLIVAGATALAFGLFRGEGRIVLQKAIHVCLECIGLG